MAISILLLVFAAVVGSTAMTAVLTWLILRARDGRLPGGSPNDLRLLQNEVRRLGDELDATGAELERLRERMDFTERLLSSGEEGDGTPP